MTNKYDAARDDYLENIAKEVSSGEGDVGFAVAIGSPSWEEFHRVGRLEAALLVQYGLLNCEVLVDVGCGAGRLAVSLPESFAGRYIGTDISEMLLSYAERLVNGPRIRFVQVNDLTIPLETESVDMVSMFSLLTHLRHEESFLYLRDAMRVLRPGGKIIFSFLDFSQESHWSIFHETVSAVETKALHHVNQFMSRDLISAWARMLGCEVVQVHDGQGWFIECVDSDGTVRFDSIGQSVAVWEKP